ncbi:MAG: hypothetical protein ACMUIG_07570 [Thermoplasmatota archaeon]
MSPRQTRNEKEEKEYIERRSRLVDFDYFTSRKSDEQKYEELLKKMNLDPSDTLYFTEYQKKIKNKRGKLLFIQLYLLFFILLFLIIPIFFHLNDDFLITKSEIITILVYVSCMGGLGGTLYALRGYAMHMHQMDFNFKWESWYYIRPFLGFIMGFVSYLIIAGGLMVLENSSMTDGNVVFFYMAVAFLAGFSVKQFIDKLHDIAKSIF